ncbi:transmembrane protein, putative (macronuclear) [Tetrahymena thermophila SB210]|uniref:Transmembrane protein, putative n=1 Tax=Tetrahymena thermophila (strain SB210) TaxID=312017 RepID=W7XDV7_TETTS|nr:transmembrane protein, putative [Tetrahymena thermophila SB210]EWS72061.1 transmembrane protein, putative [Tetrahymena thermophila SB210]|eukprot:XP_012655372.1 transmembrane protein, putative [Tetrahymena thermophila SB210]
MIIYLQILNIFIFCFQYFLLSYSLFYFQYIINNLLYQMRRLQISVQYFSFIFLQPLTQIEPWEVAIQEKRLNKWIDLANQLILKIQIIITTRVNQIQLVLQALNLGMLLENLFLAIKNHIQKCLIFLIQDFYFTFFL